MRARRALLYVPGSDARKMEKAAGLGADSVCFDLEDGVALNRKEAARLGVANGLRALSFGRSERLARINSVGSGLEADDLKAVLPARPDGIVIPKTAGADQVHWVSDQIAAFERREGLDNGAIGIIAQIESARAIVDLPQIAGSDPRLHALIFGAEDFAADVGAVRTREGTEVLYARSAVVTVAAAYGLQAIDLLFLDFHDTPGLIQEARRGALMGYAGMQVIHPNQVEPVQQAYTPDDTAIAQAQKLVAAYGAQQAAGSGAFALDGKMVDRPIVRAAERILARARAAGKIE